jgi:hypothetical protein
MPEIRCYRCSRIIDNSQSECFYCASQLETQLQSNNGGYESFPILILRGLYLIVVGCFAFFVGVFLIPAGLAQTSTWVTLLGIYLWTFLPAIIIGAAPPRVIYPPPLILKLWYLYIVIGSLCLYFYPEITRLFA